ncbi:MAG TPA: hypothetical protein VHX42_04530 [Candidatus Babeliales bacterium]|jgi:hypothetical protein|nr:hypothetical protein [Candidatus Babeliales bacterium]
MNKLHVLALTGLMFSGVNKISAMGQEQREVLYALNTLGQNLADVPMVVQNLDMFMGVVEMNIQMNQVGLKAENQNIKDALWKNAAFLTGAWISIFTMNSVGVFAFKNLPKNIRCALPTMILSAFIEDILAAGMFTSKVFVGMNLYDVWKNRSALMDAIALDTEILGKLQEIKASMEFMEENADSAESFLLNDAE